MSTTRIIGVASDDSMTAFWNGAIRFDDFVYITGHVLSVSTLIDFLKNACLRTTALIPMTRVLAADCIALHHAIIPFGQCVPRARRESVPFNDSN